MEDPATVSRALYDGRREPRGRLQTFSRTTADNCALSPYHVPAICPQAAPAPVPASIPGRSLRFRCIAAPLTSRHSITASNRGRCGSPPIDGICVRSRHGAAYGQPIRRRQDLAFSTKQKSNNCRSRESANARHQHRGAPTRARMPRAHRRKGWFAFRSLESHGDKPYQPAANHRCGKKGDQPGSRQPIPQLIHRIGKQRSGPFGFLLKQLALSLHGSSPSGS